MIRANVRKRTERITPASSSYTWTTVLLMFTVMVLFVFLSVYLEGPSPAVSADAPFPDFSSARAMKHLRAIATKPHPIGSIEHLEVRDYILKELAGKGKLDPNIQRTTVVNEQFGTPFRAGTVENVVARLKGTDSSSAILLVGHYDIMPTSFGARYSTTRSTSVPARRRING